MTTSATFSLLETPPDAFQLFADKGKSNAKASNLKTLVSAMLGGSYVGMGGMLSLAISGNMGGVAAANPGLAKLVFAVLFPVNLLLCVQAGGQLFTGNTANMAAAVCEKKATMKDLARSWSLSYVGNLVGCVTFAALCQYCGLLTGGAADLAAKTLVAKTSTAFGPLIVKSMLCNWLVCLALFLSFQAKDMMGKYISILLPISTFVAIGFEHSVANMFLLPAGLFCSTGVSIKTALFNNLLPVTLGNALSGSMLVGVMFSFLFGRLGDGK
jgi:formate/nitrite transporter